MKITDVRTTLLTGPCTNDPFIRQLRQVRSAAFIEVLTDGPHTGIGETYAGYFCPEAVPAIVEFFKPILVGQTVEDIPELWRRMYHCGNFWCRVGLGISRASNLANRCTRSWAVAGTSGSRPTPREVRAIIPRKRWRGKSTTTSRSAFAASRSRRAA
jgi:hypothetical protein